MLVAVGEENWASCLAFVSAMKLASEVKRARNHFVVDFFSGMDVVHMNYAVAAADADAFAVN